MPTRIPDFGGHAWNTPTAINNDGVVVGFSLPACQYLVSPYLLIAGDVNADGEIAGFTGDGFGSLATPDRSNTAGKSNAAQPVYWELPANVRRFLRRCGIED